MPRVLSAILFAALLIRLGWVLSRDHRDEVALANLPDQREYLTLGRNLLDGRGLVMRDDRLGVDVHAFRAPGYPIAVALCGGNILTIRIAQALLDTSTILAVYLLARKFLPPAACVFASVLVAFNPYLIYFSSLILSETLFIALLAWGMYFLTSRNWWIGSLILALSVLVRPSAMLLPMVLSMIIVPTSRDRIMRPFVSSALVLLVLFPWAYRNHRVIDRWVWTTSNGGITMYDGFHADATGASDQRFMISKITELQALPNEVDRSDHLTHQALEFIKANPGRSVVLALKKISRTWSPIPLSAEYGGNVRIVILAAIYTIPLFALTIVGLCRSNLSTPAKVFLLLPAIYFTAIHAFSVGSLRYRLPADVPMAVVAASTLKKRVEVRG
ncbi:MAG: glycosyltransferase family 39 protein [Anaerolineae bacterium]|nr:glycosyltransferase family 39 protein [Phycisphaerae bacterium]